MGGLLWFVALVVCVAAVGGRVGRQTGSSPADAILRAALVATAAIVASTMVAGAAGYLRLGGLLTLDAAIAATAIAWPGRRSTRFPQPTFDAFPIAAVAIVAAFIAFACAFAVWRAPLTLYDSVSYHLHFAARWVQDHTIAIIPTPFSDEAQAYAPGNGELVLAWLMLPWHSDAIARMGQLPFALFGALAVYAIARRMDRSPAEAVYPSAFFLLSRPIAEQMVGANVDLICASFFAAAMYFTIVAVHDDRRCDWTLAGIAIGLYAGTKYLALVYLPVLVLLACARGVRRRALWAIPGIVAFALPWYARNWIVAGSPIYPASLAVGGVTIARGAFTRAAMMNTIFHTTDVGLFPAMAAHAVGPALFVVWLPCALAGWTLMLRRGWWPTGAIALVPLVMVPLYWFGFPVNVDARFLMPAVGPAMLPLAFLFSRGRRWNTAVHVAYTAALAWLVVGSPHSLPGTVPWFMSGWLALDGLIRTAYLPPFAGVAAAVGVACLAVRRSPRLALPVLTSVLACASVTLAIGATKWCGEAGCEYLDTTSPYIRSGYLESWQWVSQNVSNATIAYTGINLPYPLTGERLTNRVVYVNIDGRARWRFHDYDRAFRSGRFVPDPPRLAESSGELLPVAQRAGPRDDALRPRYERMHGNRDAWVFNLESMRVRYLFVAMLSAYEIDYVWHNERGFPIEDEWALADPGRFRLVYTNPQVHIYEFDDAVRARG